MAGRINDPATGGTTDYYGIHVRHPRRQKEPALIDVDDLSAALKLTPEEFNIVKAIVRSANARRGNGKPGYDDHDARIRDAKKMAHYASCNLKILEDEKEDLKDTQDVSLNTEFPALWLSNPKIGNVVPEGAEGTIEIELASGDRMIREGKELIWGWFDGPNSIVKWRPVKE